MLSIPQLMMIRCVCVSACILFQHGLCSRSFQGCRCTCLLVSLFQMGRFRRRRAAKILENLSKVHVMHMCMMTCMSVSVYYNDEG